MNSIKIYGLGIMGAAIIVLLWLYNAEKEERQRLAVNQTSLLEDITYYRTADSLSAASVGELTLEKNEFEKYNAELVKSAEALNLKVKRLEAAIQTAVKTEYKIKTEIKDSLIYVPGEPAPVKVPCIDYNDTWLTIDGCIVNKEFSGLITTVDSLNHFINRVPRWKFLGMQLGTKGINMDVVSKNPYSQIYYVKYISFK